MAVFKSIDGSAPLTIDLRRDSDTDDRQQTLVSSDRRNIARPLPDSKSLDLMKTSSLDTFLQGREVLLAPVLRY